MRPVRRPEHYRLWSSDECISSSFDPDECLFLSIRIGAEYRVQRYASEYLQRECDKLGEIEGDRLKARLATILIDRLNLGESRPLVDTKMVLRLCSNSRRLTVSQRTNRLLRYLANFDTVINGPICLFVEASLHENALGWSESIRERELKKLLDYLIDAGLVIEETDRFGYSVTLQGYEKIENDSVAQESSEVFVALWFNETVTDVRNAIECAIGDAGYRPIVIDDQAFDGLIDDEIAARIRSAKFVVADLTHGKKGTRGSVYYEAGFARGLEKTVILTVREDHLHDGNDYNVAFDLDHYPIITWSKRDLDKFASNLQIRIEALFGKGPSSEVAAA